MRIGITTEFRHSAFSGGHANTSFSIANAFQTLGHEVFFIHNQNSDDVWWDDIHDLKQNAPMRVRLENVEKHGFDLVIESSFHLTPIQRGTVKASVWYSRKSGIFSDIESTVYGCRSEGRCLEGLKAIWLAGIFTSNEDLTYFKTLYPTIPIYTVPWIWTPEIIESHRKATGSPVWIQAYQSIPKDTPWSFHISESNTSNTSSCTLPLVILRQLLLNKEMSKLISRVTVHNTELLEKNQFFKDNVLKHCSVPDLSYNLIGRQRIIDWVHDPHSLVLSHSRFVPLKMGLLEAVWVGLPLVHNSQILEGFGQGLERLYYSSNSVTGAVKAIETAIQSTASIPYLQSIDALTELRKKILERFYPQANMNIQGWKLALDRLVASPIPKQLTPILPALEVKPPTVTLLFTDMWDQFNESYNIFTLALENALEAKRMTIKGYSITNLQNGIVPDLVIFGPFGKTWTTLPSTWPKVHYTGENTPPIHDPSVKLNIGYQLQDSHSYLRVPLWQFEIDWFNADPTRIRNPIPLPLDACLGKDTSIINHKRDSFCAFIVTNPKNTVRNEAFNVLNSYKPVSSAGRLYNNMGDQIFAGLGGGGGEIKKHEFLKNYRFCIAYENESFPGYTTEKLLHAKAAGCIPIYWGDPKVSREFDDSGFLNASGCKTAADLIDLVDKVERDPERQKAIRSVPGLTLYSRDLARKNLAEMVRRLLICMNRSDLTEGLPLFLGAKSSPIVAQPVAHPVAQPVAQPVASLIAPPVAPPVASLIAPPVAPPMIFVTGATKKFWPSLSIWLQSLATYSQEKRVRVYVGSDVDESTLKSTMESHRTVDFIRFPKETPETFSDFWNPIHYAWKLWIYNTVVHDPLLKGSLVFYMDVASILVRWPTEWIDQAKLSGASFLDDCRQKNRSWCHRRFCDALRVSEDEKGSNQIAACLLLFVAGHPVPRALFKEAYELGKIRDIVVGEKWEGIGPDGKPFGHRHDQSILSILSQRAGCSRVPIDTVYGDTSIRDTFYSGKSVYVHRGNIKTHIQIIEGIDDAYILNLDRREDRLKSFFEYHHNLKGCIRRQTAYDGRTLKLTASLVNLFKPNDFFWKKSIMGCAMSHMKLWEQLAKDNVSSYLIVEDDARLNPEWASVWAKAYPNLPKDWDCVYLGGVLPPNRQVFMNTLEHVASGLAKVAPNQIFGQKVPTRYFHFCAYAYVLSRRGAKKIMDSIEARGYWTSADHMICNRIDDMNLFVLNPLMAGASQDDDPAYKTAQFNNFNRIDNFDSDLWNNDERFTPDEIQALSISTESKQKSPQEPRFVALKSCIENANSLYESKWLQDLFQSIPFKVETVESDKTFDQTDSLIVVLIRPKWEEQLKWLEGLRRLHTFKIIHIGDEYSTDPIYMYSWPEVTGVLRFYTRPNLDPKVIVLPLGYHHQFKGNRDVPHIGSPGLAFRENMWSFAGTDWMERSKEMSILQAIQPHYLNWFGQWRDPGQLKGDEYISLLLNTKCVPCPRGQNLETYRFYEALECGCIPIVIDTPGVEEWLQKFHGIPFLKLHGWDNAAGLIKHFQENPEQMESYRNALLVGWSKYKMELKEKVAKWLGKN